MAVNLKYLIDADEMTPEERLDRIIDLMSQAVLRMIKDGDSNKKVEAEKPTKWKAVQIEKNSNGLQIKIQMNTPNNHPSPIQTKAPRIQHFLIQARDLNRRLEDDPRLTKSALAKEIGISRFELRHNLKLIHLAPEIQEFLLALPPSKKEYPITKRKLRKISMISNHQEQRDEFCQLLSQTLGGRWRCELVSGFESIDEAKETS